MGKQLLTLILLVLFCHNLLNAIDYVNINYDKQTLAQLTTNTATQEATNTLHNAQVDSVKKRQSRLLTLVADIAAHKRLLMQTYENVSGFKKEKKYYIAMVATGSDIIDHSAKAIEVINKSSWTGKTMMILNISKLVNSAISLGKAFSDIVANCEVPNPINHPDANSAEQKKDKYNLLNRHERLQMANDILFRLKNIDRAICYLTYLCKNTDVKDLLFHLDRKTYLNYIMSRININSMIDKWNRISN